MKVEIGMFGDGCSLKVLVRFEKTSNFWAQDDTWVPKLDEVQLILRALLAIDEYNKIMRSLSKNRLN